ANYTSPNATGSLSYTPVANANGTAHITVCVKDDGGTASGGVNFVKQTFTVAVTAVNDAPTISAVPSPATQNVQYSDAIAQVSFKIGRASSKDGQIMTVSETSEK